MKIRRNKKRMSSKAAVIKRSSISSPEGELNYSTPQIENHERNEVFQKVVDYVNGQHFELPQCIGDFEFVQESMGSLILTESLSYQRMWDTLKLCHADGSHVRVCTYKEDELFISHIEVDESRRGQGIGTAMMLFLLDLIENACGRGIKISLDVTRGGLNFVPEYKEMHKIRLGFFRRFGFRLNPRLSRYPSYCLMELDQAKYELVKSTPIGCGELNSAPALDVDRSWLAKLKLFDESTVSSLHDTVLGYASDANKLINLLKTFDLPIQRKGELVAQKDNKMFNSIKSVLIESAFQFNWFDEVSSVINQPAVNCVSANEFERVLQFRNVLHFSFNNGCQLRITSLAETIEITIIEVPVCVRRQGLGTKLVEMLFELAKFAGFDKPGFSVYLNENKEQDGLIKFYASLGFEPQVIGSNGSVMMVVNHQFNSDDFEMECEVIEKK
ncbi:MAG: GNAT family N-acetyltransferase [Cryomorphaceae bacterium]|nr:GNAT family N-acetyltransferase [Cryomorphaceae bacterium]